MRRSSQRRRVQARFAAVAVAGTLVAIPSSALGAEQVWWGNFSGDKVSFANLDGSGGGGDLTNTTGATAPNDVSGIALDPAAGRVYWASNNGQKISYANLDGTGGGNDLNTTGASAVAPRGLAIDRAAGRIYWASAFGASPGIYYANLDGSGGGPISTAGATVAQPMGIAIDPSSNRIYWPNYDATNGNKISFANLDGSGGGDDLNTTGATVSQPWGIAVDPVGGRVFWSNTNIGSDAQKLAFTNTDDSGGGGNLGTAGSCTICAPPGGPALDADANRVYWANSFTSPVSFANLDGSGAGGELDATGASAGQMVYPAILRRPVGAGGPAVSGGSTTGSTVSCSQGSWAPSRVGGHLYRDPRTIGFAWTRNGAEIAGATSSTHTAAAPGAYACQVTATNAAGTAGPQASAAHQVADPPPAVKKCKKGQKLKKGKCVKKKRKKRR